MKWASLKVVHREREREGRKEEKKRKEKMQVKLIGLIFAILCLHQASAQLGSTDKITDDLTVFIGGNQTPSSGPAGNHVTMYNLQEAAWSSFNWGCNGVVRQIKVVDESIYLAGDFDQCDNTFYGPLVKYDIPSGEFSSLLPDGAYWMNAYDETTQSFGDPISVRDFQLYKGKLYIVGLFAINFTATNELASNVAAVDIRTGQWKTFGAGLNGRVNSLWVQDEKTLLLVGRFTRSGYGETFNPDDFFTDIGFAVWHEDHFRYGTGYMSYTIPVSYNNFDLEFGFDNSTEIFAIWRGVIQVYPNGDNLNVPLNTPEPERLTIVLAGNFPGGVLYQQDSLPWRRPAGGVWGGPVYRLAPFLEQNAFFFGGAFDHVGAENATDPDAVLAGAVVQWNFQLDVPRGGNSNPLPSWDNLLGGVAGGEVYGLSYIPKYGLLALTGSFTSPYSKITYFDLSVQNYFALGEGNEFSADLYAVAFSNTQVSTNVWSGLWDSPQLVGSLSTCVVGSTFFAGNGYIAFEGTISRNGRGVSGIFYTAGASEYANRGSFGIVLSPDAMSFSGWLAYDGEMGRQDFTGSRLAFSQPDLLIDCMAVDYAEGGTLAGQWQLADDDSTILNLCLVGLESSEASSNENGARYYTGLVGFPGKTVQAQYFDGKGYGLVIFRQSSENQMVTYWFSGDVRDLDPTSDCIDGVTCGVDVWVRNDTRTAEDEACHLNDYFNAWTGTWSSCGVFSGSNIYLRPDGTGLVHGAFLGGVLEGQIDSDNAYRMTGYWSAGGFDEVAGVLRGTFEFQIDVGLPWLGRSFRGNFTINDNINGVPFNNPLSFNCNTQRYSSLLPLPNPSFFQSPSAGATVEGIWRKPDGDLLYVCVVEPNSDTDATVVASLGKNRYYEGDAYSVTAEGIEYFTSYSSPDTNSRDTSTLNYWGASSKVQGLALFRRVSETLLEETWVQVLPNRYKWSDLNVNNCTPETCQLADRGSNAVIYDYVGPVTLSQCSQANSLRGRRPGSTIADPTD